MSISSIDWLYNVLPFLILYVGSDPFVNKAQFAERTYFFGQKKFFFIIIIFSWLIDSEKEEGKEKVGC